MRFIADTDGEIIDTHTTPKGSYTQPDGERTDVLQQKSHFDKNTQNNHGTTHTHEPYSNTNTQTGITRTGASESNTQSPTYQEAQNIQTGKAKKVE